MTLLLRSDVVDIFMFRLNIYTLFFGYRHTKRQRLAVANVNIVPRIDSNTVDAFCE